MSRVATITQVKGLPYALALAFACAWMIDPSLVVPLEFAELIPISQYPHLVIVALAFCVLVVARKRIAPWLIKPSFFVSASVLCIVCFAVPYAIGAASSNPLLAVSMVCCCVIALYLAAMLVLCLVAFAHLSMVDCLLTLIAWQLFVALLRAAATLLPPFAVSLCAPLVIAFCLTRKSVSPLLAIEKVEPLDASDSANLRSSRWFPLRLMLMNALVIFTIQALQSFSPDPVTGVSFIGSFVAIALTVVVLVVSKRFIRVRQLYNISLVVMELGITVFSIGGFAAFRLASILLDAAYLAFSAFFFTVLCNTCQRNKRDAILLFACAYIFEQIAAFSGGAMALAIGPGVHALPLVLLAALGAVAFTCFPTEEDYSTAWHTALRKPKYADPATYFYSLSEICSSVAMQYSLSKREGDVLLLLAQKKTATQISEDLVVSVATVKTHTHNIYKKLGVHSRQELLDFVGLNDGSNDGR